LNNANGQAGGTRPMLLSEYSTTIVNAHQLQLIVLDPTANYKLAADIDLGPALTNPSEVWYTAANAPSYGSGFIPIGTWTPQFTGTFDGQGHTISNLIINRPGDYNVGLFGYVGAGGVIENVNLAGGSVSGYQRVGDLVGKNHGLVENSSASGTVSGDEYVGGLAGGNNNTIAQSYATGAVAVITSPGGFGASIGGLVGINDGSIKQSYATGSINMPGASLGAEYVGGLVGSNDSNGTITKSYATGAVGPFGPLAAYTVGGLVASNKGTITLSYATGSVFGAIAGGLVGVSQGSIAQSYATGSVEESIGGAPAGGLVAENLGSIAQSYETGLVFQSGSGEGGSSILGGLVEENYSSGSITLSYAMGAVRQSFNNFAPGSTGGLVGSNDGVITQSYATGAVFGRSNTGGLVGSNTGSVTTSYWDTVTTGQTQGVGTNTGTFSATGLTTTQLQATLPPGFDPTVWGIVSGATYPYLKNVPPTL
jgi:hypothetical protein